MDDPLNTPVRAQSTSRKVTKPQSTKTVFFTVTDHAFFPGTLATVNSILRFHDDAHTDVVVVEQIEHALSDSQRGILTAHPSVSILSSNALARDGRHMGAWELKAYAAAELIQQCAVLVGIDSDCLLCAPVADVISACHESGGFHGGQDGDGRAYDASFDVYGMITPAHNPRYMSTSLYFVASTGANHLILDEWAERSSRAVYNDTGPCPGHGDQGLLNAILFARQRTQDVHLLDNALWSQHGCYWQSRIIRHNGSFLNQTALQQIQRSFHCGGTEKFWELAHRERMFQLGPWAFTAYTWFLDLLWGGACQATSPATWLPTANQHLADDARVFLPASKLHHTLQRKLILKNYLSPGDIVTLTAAVRDLHHSHPGKFITDVRTSCPALWEHNPFITPVADDDPQAEIIECHYPLIHQSNTAPYHMLHGFRMFLEDKLGVVIQAHSFKGDIHLSAEEKSWMSQVEELEGLGTRYWIIVSGGKLDFTAKWWDPDRAQAVVDHFKGRIRFVQCGEAQHHHPALRDVLDLRGKTDARQLVRLMYHADGVVCPVTFLMHLAAAVETKPGRAKNRACVVIAGGREPSQWEAYPHHQFLHTNGMLPCCDQGGCWKSRVEPLHDGDDKDSSLCLRPITMPSGRKLPQCLDMITAPQVITAVENYLAFTQPVRRTTCADCHTLITMEDLFCNQCGAAIAAPSFFTHLAS